MTRVRLLLAAMSLAPVSAQDIDVAKFLGDLRAESEKAAASKPSDSERLVQLTKFLEDAPSARQKADIYVEIARLRRNRGESAASLASLRNARELRPENPRISLQLAEALAADNQDAEAHEFFRFALGVDPHDTTALIGRASKIVDANGDLDIALACAQLAVRLDPVSSRVLDTLGLIDMKKANLGAAILVYRGLVEQAPTVSTYHYHLGMAFLQAGSIESARSELVAALRLNPALEERASIEKLLAYAPEN